MKLADLLAAKAIINGGGSGGGNVTIFPARPAGISTARLLQTTDVTNREVFLTAQSGKIVKFFSTKRVNYLGSEYTGAFFAEVVTAEENGGDSYNFTVITFDGRVEMIAGADGGDIFMFTSEGTSS